MAELIFLKLGGSLITDKDKPYTPRQDALTRLANEIATVLDTNPGLQLVLGHGSGSFGHAAAEKYKFTSGASNADAIQREANKDFWAGVSEIRYQATRLNGLVMDSLREAGLNGIPFPPSASIVARDTKILSWNTEPIRIAIKNKLLPVIFGDVVFDETRTATILSTERLFAHLTEIFNPNRILLAGREDGVWREYPKRTEVISRITNRSLEEALAWIRGSASADVTGGMRSKVIQMSDLVRAKPGLSVQIFSGMQPGNVSRALLGETIGTMVLDK